MSTSHSSRSKPDARPDFMVTLGLLPPYQDQDVEKAYHAKNAYTRAKEYVKFRGNRRGWIANQVDAYMAVHEVIDRLQQFGAKVEIEALDWLKRSFGDFAQLTESVVGVRLRDAANGDEVLNYLVSQQERLLELRRLDLAGSKISDNALRRLNFFRRLAELDVSRTPVTWQGLQVVAQLPELESVRAEGTQLGWLGRWRLNRVLSRNRKSAATARTVHPTRIG
jgi:hypothetical protein